MGREQRLAERRAWHVSREQRCARHAQCPITSAYSARPKQRTRAKCSCASRSDANTGVLDGAVSLKHLRKTRSASNVIAPSIIRALHATSLQGASGGAAWRCERHGAVSALRSGATGSCCCGPAPQRRICAHIRQTASCANVALRSLLWREHRWCSAGKVSQ